MNKFVATIVTASVLFTTGVFSKPLLNVRLRGAEEDTLENVPVSAASAARPHLHSGNEGNWDITPEYHCGGIRIYDWESGGSAAYGNGQDSLAECEATCLAHDDCNAFVLRDRDSLCSFWKGGILTLKPAAGHHCYAKRTPPTEAECIAADVCPVFTAPPTPSPTPLPTREPNAGRCGPLFGGRVCNCNGWEVYCNTDKGWCGNTDAHQNAQSGEEYDCPTLEPNQIVIEE